MPCSIAVSFPGGRFHGTPWGRHPNEGVVEWPPSPWRLLRALAAAWKRALPDDPLISAHIAAVLGKLSLPPVFRLPPAAIGQTRHYMPWYKKGPSDKTMVFDNFVAVDARAELGVHWPGADLTDGEQEVMARLLKHLNYLGRAESWCEARLCYDWAGLPGTVCSWLDPVTGEAGPELEREGYEPVRVLCADPHAWHTWGYGQQSILPDPPWNLLAETLQLHAERWSDPPGARWLTYFRPRDAFAVRPARRTVSDETLWFGQSGASAGRPPTLARFACSGVVLPRLTETVYVAEIARRYVQGVFGRRHQQASSPTLSGKESDGSPCEDGHAHAFYLPADDDGDGRLDHLNVYAPHGFGVEEVQALSAFRKMHGPGGAALQLLLLGVGYPEHFPDARLVARARLWRSATPFIATRHYKERGAKRDIFPREQLAEMNLREELARRGLPEPARVAPLPALPLPRGRSLHWRDFRQQRVFGDGRRGSEFGKGFEIEFPEPVQGPIAVGYACHFGLGLFVAVPE